MIYVVTGRHRTGTSMMMQALAAGGLTPYVDMELEESIRSRQVDPDYDPNPNGYFQSALSDLSALGDGALVKVPVYAWASIDTPCLVVHMVRNDESRKASLERSFGIREDSSPLQDAYERGEAALARRDGVTRFDYASVVRRPTTSFRKLARNGWPIDPTKAAPTVDKALYRNGG